MLKSKVLPRTDGVRDGRTGVRTDGVRTRGRPDGRTRACGRTEAGVRTDGRGRPDGQTDGRRPDGRTDAGLAGICGPLVRELAVLA